MNKKHIKERSDYKKLPIIRKKYSWNYRKYRCELVVGPKNQFNQSFIDKELVTKLIMDSRAAAAHKFRTRLGYKQYVVVTMSPMIMSYKNKKFIERRKHANTL